MDKFSELKAAALAATPGRIGDRIDGSGSIKYECTGYDGSLVLRTDHKDMEYGFVGDNAYFDELFFRLCVPDVVLELLADNEHLARELVARNGENEWLRKRAAELEAKDERIGELEAIATEYAGKFQKAQDALKYTAIMSDDDKKKIAELEAEITNIVDSHAETVAELRAKLATPVRLPDVLFIKVSGSAVPVMHADRVKERVHAAGFTVEGDE
ncbi:ead/Ea22-like family protein [Serratia marcescens]|uniref:ead/Ea22-like family protein n=1 Tax=Serratia marcescens TaxID=615 RepID=UPI001C944EAD|nr:ead/Ea22-like family protein [Serratia marcescens]MBY4847783.1 ead/Ea22-like family protein [Serratia marcescens]MCH9865790.1 ead/Ea22-like family protein [Serratia marcescens]